MTICDPSAGAGRSGPVENWAREFLERWNEEQGRLADGFRGFVASHPVPPAEREAVGERVQELLLEDGLRHGDV